MTRNYLLIAVGGLVLAVLAIAGYGIYRQFFHEPGGGFKKRQVES